MSGPKWRIIAAAGAALGLLAIIGYLAVALTVPPRLGLSSGSSATPRTTPDGSASTAAACRRPVLPSAAATPQALSLWLIQSGSVVGYRVRERFVQLPSPHEAVARTKRVSGWVLASQTGSGIQVETGCVAVEVATLKSVDSIPGYGTEGRDQIYPTLFETDRNPYVIFQPYPVSLDGPREGQTIHVALPGILEMRGVAKAAQFSLDVKLSSGKVFAAGSAPVDVNDYGLGVIEGPEGFIAIDPRCTLELSLILSKV